MQSRSSRGSSIVAGLRSDANAWARTDVRWASTPALPCKGIPSQSYADHQLPNFKNMPPEVFRQIESKDSYGWFEMEELATLSSPPNNSPDYYPSTTSSRRNSWDKKTLEQMTVLFMFRNISSSSSCKSFECLNLKQNSIHIQISIPNFRIVQGEDGLRAEYRIVFTINHDSRSAWRRYSDFIRLARSLNLHYGYWTLFQDFSSHPMPLSLDSWLHIESNKSWFRSLSIRYLSWKCDKLEEFLKHVLFENSSPDVLMDFVSPQI